MHPSLLEMMVEDYQQRMREEAYSANHAWEKQAIRQGVQSVLNSMRRRKQKRKAQDI